MRILLSSSKCRRGVAWRGHSTVTTVTAYFVTAMLCTGSSVVGLGNTTDDGRRTTARGPVRLMGHANENTPSTCKCSTISCRQFGRHWLDRPEMEGFWKPGTKMLILGQPRSRTFLSESTTWHFKHILSRWKPCNQTNQQRASQGSV
jgi:hypothetical protein